MQIEEVDLLVVLVVGARREELFAALERGMNGQVVGCRLMEFHCFEVLSGLKKRFSAAAGCGGA